MSKVLWKEIKIGRLLWVLFLAFYFFFFWKNLTHDIFGTPFFIPVFMGLYLWTLRLDIEFYFKLPFHQSGFIYKNRYRTIYAILFYSFLLLLFLESSTFKVLPPGLNGIPFLISSFIGLFFLSLGEWVRLVTLKEIFNRDASPVLKVKHPRYSGLILEVIGFPLLFGEPLLLIYSFLLILLIVREARYEEEILKGQKWYTKRSSLPSFFPFF